MTHLLTQPLLTKIHSFGQNIKLDKSANPAGYFITTKELSSDGSDH